MPRPAFLLRTAAAAAAALMLNGCIAYGTIDNRATTINESVGESANRGVLLNLIRASRLEPLYFLSMANINGSATQDLKLGLPSGTLGPNQTQAQRTYTFGGNSTNVLDNNTTTSFQVGVLGSKDFYAGLLSPLGLNDVNLLFNQGFSRELVLYLVIDRITVTDVTGLAKDADDTKAPTAVYYNDPSSPTYPRFEHLIAAAMTHGLTTEPAPYRSPTAGDPNSAGRPANTAPAAQLCYDWALATEDAKKDFPDATSRCGAAPVAQANSPKSSKLAVNLDQRQLEIDVRTRSIFGIFTYLGGLIARGEQGPAAVAAVHLHQYALPSENTQDALLLNVVKGGPSGDGCFSAADYAGQRYCVPNDANSDNTKRIFNILNALLALKTSQGDLPVTQTVRITP